MHKNFKYIKNTDKKYAINKKGKVISFKLSNKGTRLRIQLNTNGYFYVLLYKKPMEKKHYYIHRLIAETFIPNPNNYPEVNHKNGIKTDNRISNLEWCTHQMNGRHASKTGLIKVEKPGQKVTKKIRAKILYLLSKKVSHRKIAKMFNITYGYVSLIKNKKRLSRMEDKNVK